MYHLLVAAVLALTHLAITAPTAQSDSPCKAKVFNIPWMITQITLYQPPTSSPEAAEQPWVRFNFIDSNPRLRIETVCYGNLTNGSVQSPEGGYVLCADEDVAFRFFGMAENGRKGRLNLERFYQDDCLGDWPYNYGFAYGDGTVTMSPPLPSTAGALRYQDQMLVNITRMG